MRIGTLVLLVAGIGIGAAIGISMARTRARSVVEAPRELHVPKHDDDWKNVARTGPFVGDDGKSARPYSDARIAWSDGKIWLKLYAADEDIESATDSFHVAIGTKTFDLGPSSAEDVDGTVDKPDDDDEEWVIETSIPVDDAKPGARIPFSIRRCDTPRGFGRTCGQFGEKRSAILVLD